MDFSSDVEISKIPLLTQAFFENVLYDEEPLFVSDEATIWDVSMSGTEDLLQRCAAYYRTPVSLDDLRRPLWQLLPNLEARRQASEEGPLNAAPFP